MMKYIIPFLLLSLSSTAQTIPVNKQAVLSSVAKHEKELIGLSDEVWAHAEIAMKEHQSALLSRNMDQENPSLVFLANLMHYLAYLKKHKPLKKP